MKVRLRHAPGAHQAPRRGRPRCVAADVGEVFLPHQYGLFPRRRTGLHAGALLYSQDPLTVSLSSVRSEDFVT